MNYKIKIGIDPGLSGAIAVLMDNCKNIRVFCMPVKRQPWSKPRKNKTFQQMVDIEELMIELKIFSPSETIINIETVTGMPTDGAHRAFIFGGAFYSVLTLLNIMGFKVNYIAPATWKAKVGLTLADKEDSRQLVLRLFPDIEGITPVRKTKIKTGLTKAMCQGRAEAVLIGLY